MNFQFRSFESRSYWFCLCFCGFSLFLRSFLIFKSEYFNSSAEAAGLNGILDILDNRSLYPRKFSEPYSIFLYNPLFPYLSAWLIKLFDLRDLFSQVILIRLLVLICFALLVLVVFRLSKQLKIKSRWVLMPLFFLGTSKVFDDLGTTRNDLPTLFLELLAVSCFVSFIQSPKTKHLLIAVICCHLAFWIRQSSILIPLCILIWLFHKKLYRQLFVALSLNSILLFLFGSLLYFKFGKDVMDHLIYANVRPWKPLDFSLVTASNISFIGSIALFSWFTLKVILDKKETKSDSEKFLVICILVSLILGILTWFRAGGDFNYFFLPLFLSFFFAGRELTTWLNNPALRPMISCQLFIIGLIYTLKVGSATRYLNLPFSKTTQNIRSELKKLPGRYVLITGHFSQNMSIYLRDFALHGPEITSGCWLSRGSHPELNWLEEQAKSAMRQGKISAIIQAEPSCANSDLKSGDWLSGTFSRRALTNWLCIYEVRQS